MGWATTSAREQNRIEVLARVDGRAHPARTSRSIMSESGSCWRTESSVKLEPGGRLALGADSR